MDGAGHPDSSEEERRETHQTQVTRHVLHGRTHFLSSNPSRGEPELVGFQEFVVSIPKFVSVLPLRHSEVGVIASDGSEGQQTGRGQLGAGDIEARTDGGLEPELRGQPDDFTPENEPDLPNQQRVTHGSVELNEDGGVGNRRGPVVDHRPCAGRCGGDLSVIWVPGIHTLNLEEPHALAPGIEHHRRKRGRASDVPLLRRHGVEYGVERFGERPVGRDPHVCPE